HDQSSAASACEDLLRLGDSGLVEVYKKSKQSPKHLLLVIDQFEDLFKYRDQQGDKKNSEDAAVFIALLLNATRQHKVPIFVAVTMQSDFLGDSTDFIGLPEAINEGQYLIPRMPPREQQVAILSPLLSTGTTITYDLQQQLLTDLKDSIGSLP